MPLQDYEVIDKIGSGKYASVYKVRHIHTQQEFALKRVPFQTMNSRSKSNALNEVNLLKALNHPHIISFIELCLDQQTGHLSLVLELGTRDLSELLHEEQPVKEDFIWSILFQVSSGLEYLHNKNILHRDIKTSNILLFPNNTAKISDFNVSKSLNQLNYTRTGTLSYASPEVWKGQTYDQKADIWSLGCLLYELTTKRHPFEGSSLQKISKKVLKCQYPKIPENYSKQLRDLISFMIQLNPRLRPSAKTIHRICRNRGKYHPESRSKRLQSLTPFFQRTQTEDNCLSGLSGLSGIDNIKLSDIKSSKKNIRNTRILHKSNHYQRNSPEHSFPSCSRNNTISKEQSQVHVLKRLKNHKSNSKDLDQLQQQGKEQRQSKIVKFIPQKFTRIRTKISRRKTQI